MTNWRFVPVIAAALQANRTQQFARTITTTPAIQTPPAALQNSIAPAVTSSSSIPSSIPPAPSTSVPLHPPVGAPSMSSVTLPPQTLPGSTNTTTIISPVSQSQVAANLQRTFDPLTNNNNVQQLPTAPTIVPMGAVGASGLPPAGATQLRTNTQLPPAIQGPAKVKKGIKRKADTTTQLLEPVTTYPQQNTEVKPLKMSTRRESGRPIKKPSKDLPDTAQHISKPKKGKMSEQMKYCNQILKELFAKKHAGYAWPFYKPVDAELLQLHDYHEIIKHPMDLGTAKVFL